MRACVHMCACVRVCVRVCVCVHMHTYVRMFLLDMVAVFGEMTGELALKQLKHKMMQHKDGRRILRCAYCIIQHGHCSILYTTFGARCYGRSN